MQPRSSLLFVVFVLAACSTDSATGPAVAAARSALASAANGEGEEASTAARLDLRAIRAELLAVDRAYAEAAKSVNLIDALVAPLAPQGVFLAPGPVILRGPSQARAFLEATPSNALSKFTWTPIRVDVSSDGRQGYTVGYAELTLPSGAIAPGRYLTYWAKQSDGTWKAEAFKRIPRAAGAVSLTPPPGFQTPDDKHRRYFPNTDAAAEAQAAASADLAFSDLAQVVGNAEAFSRYAAPDGMQSGSSTSVGWEFGREAIAAAHAADPLGIFSWAPAIARAAASGDLAFTVGWVFNSAGQTAGKYFTVWQKQNTGEWLYVVD
jgi:ketosteroid isomerase-like protein